MSRKIITLLLAASAILGIVGYLWLERNDLQTIELVAPWYLLFSLVGMLGNLFFTGILYSLALGKLGARVSIPESVSLATLSIAANLLLPLRGGAGFRAIYLKRIHGLSYSKFAASLLVFYVLSVVVSSVICLGGACWMILVEGRRGLGPIVLISSGFLASSGLILFLPIFPRPGQVQSKFLSRVSSLLTGISEGWRALRNDYGLVALLLVTATFQISSLLLSVWGAARGIGLQLTMVEILVIGTLGILSTVLSLTPGALGIYEATVGLSTSILGIGATLGVVVALVSRTVLVILLVVLAPLSTVVLRQRTS